MCEARRCGRRAVRRRSGRTRDLVALQIDLTCSRSRSGTTAKPSRCSDTSTFFAYFPFLPFFAYLHLQVPGYFYTAQEQCRFFYHGKEGADKANPENDPFICENLKCKQGDEEVNTGPPLEGTACGGQGTQWCRGGE